MSLGAAGEGGVAPAGLLAAVTAPWAKEGKTGTPHPLVCHAIDTAAVAELLYPVMLGPQVRAELESGLAPLGDVWRWVAVSCGLHDLGKVSPVFQAQCAEIAIERMGNRAAGAIRRAQVATGRKPRKDLDHGLATAAHFYLRLQQWGARREVADAVACAVGGHHGWLPDRFTIRQAIAARAHLGGESWGRLRDATVETVVGLWGLPLPQELPWKAVRVSLVAALGLAGLTTISDWIASGRARFPWCPEVTDLVAYHRESREQAQRVVAGFGWVPWRPAETGFQALFGESPRWLQVTVQSLVEGRTRPGVLVIEAPTGEGKTKAGLQAAASMVRALSLSGIYAALPTRATGKQFYDEVNELLVRTGCSLRAVPVHGLALQQVRAEQAGQDASIMPEDLGSDLGEEQARAERIAAREWFAMNRGLLAPIGVGTVDQALRGVVRSRHTFVRLTSLSSKVLLIDEVHAFDTYTSRLLDRLLWWCGRLGIPAILMLATLPAQRRDELIAEWRAGARVEPVATGDHATVEPSGWRLTWADAEEAPAAVPVVTEQDTRRVRLAPLSDDELVDWVLDRIGTHSSAMIVHSTLVRVQATATALKKALKSRNGGTVVRVLTRGPDDADRARIEEDLRCRLGPKSKYPRNVIVVGTSALENLDLDVDVLVSDPCPIDLLLQRLGRLHRHKHQDRAIKEKEIGLVGMAGQPAPAHGKVRFPRGPANLYGRYLLEVSWAVLAGRDQLSLPEDIPDLVHAVYAHDHQTLSSMQYRRSTDLADYRGHVPCVPRCDDHDSLRDLTERPGSPNQTRRNTGPQKDRS
ncbi:CRISPR-associated helicase Cas3' [Saccharopolyspora phatthalungensis]|uniref:CRISPR-associated endonuclease/helicase Cas3 n=1 Tax=Saccharopolyspora phatthalungensis TaxID=664693 RepID=A0A840QFW8_9PSEU|nr:CRISPR-associated helicase Cas3' [Saccharopolyspora phatthalungensis]MBB5157385.1 CRISPR-associated endonuclease/helicase Cas3 [Saccharopolyspora phatthalungensis]